MSRTRASAKAAGTRFETDVAGYLAEGRRYITIAIGCTGGKHRSVAMTEELVRRLAGRPGIEVRAAHRDLGLE